MWRAPELAPTSKSAAFCRLWTASIEPTRRGLDRRAGQCVRLHPPEAAALFSAGEIGRSRCDVDCRAFRCAALRPELRDRSHFVVTGQRRRVGTERAVARPGRSAADRRSDRSAPPIGLPWRAERLERRRHSPARANMTESPRLALPRDGALSREGRPHRPAGLTAGLRLSHPWECIYAGALCFAGAAPDIKKPPG
jgi:hypothetical protein